MPFFGKGPQSADNTRLLNVEVVSGSDLMGVTQRGKAADAMVHMVLYNEAGKKTKEDFKTNVVKGTVNPAWGEKFVFGRKYAVEHSGDMHIKFEVSNRSTFSLSETPMGEFEFDLNIVDPSGTVFEGEYPLQDAGRLKNVTGTIKIKAWYNRAPMDFAETHTVALSEDPDLPPEALGDPNHPAHILAADKRLIAAMGFTPDHPDAKDLAPNELQVVIIQAKGLLALDTALFAASNTSDPYGIVRIIGSAEAQKLPKMKTKVVPKCLEPVWNEKFTLGVKSADGSIRVDLYDKNKGFDKYLGGVMMPLNQFVGKKPAKQWYTLLADGGKNDGVKRGEIEIAVRWGVSMEKIAAEEKRKAEGPGGLRYLLGLGKTDEDSAPEDDEDKEIDDFDFGDTEKKEAEEETDEEKAAREAAEKEKRDLLDEITIKTGDWIVQVHLIEARDLKAENYDGTSDPIVYVECFGQKQATQVIYSQTSCVFDELLIFHMKDLDKEQFEEGIIRVSVMDYNTLKNTMIGACVFDAANIYQSNRDHELYRQWTALIDDVDVDDVGVQGYLKLSVSIVGPDEKVKYHDVDAEMQAEIARENEAGQDLSSLLLPSPTMRKEWQYIIAKIYKCEALPIMDGKTVGFSKAGTDAYCTLSFAGGKGVKTKVKTIKSNTRLAISPIFEYELWYPVAIPSMTSIAKVNVWDYDDAGAEFIGQALTKFTDIRKLPGMTQPARWYNMYGSHEFKDDSIANNLKRAAGSVKKLAKRMGGVEIDWYKFYNNVPDRGAAYRGRTLVSWSVATERPLKYQTPEIIPFRRKITSLPLESHPKTCDYTLQALVIAGSELPRFASLSSIGYSQKLRVKIVVGIDELCTDAAKYENGMCRWNAHLVSQVLKLPEDFNQIPDIFVYLVNEGDRPVCYTRMKPYTVEPKGDVDLEGRPIDKVTLKGFLEPTSWNLLEEDKVIDALDAGEFPGSLLLKVGFGLTADAAALSEEWEQCLREAKTLTQYQTRVHLFQARNLAPADSNGLADPFVCVNFMGQRACTKIVSKSLYPTWYETVIIDNVSLPEANNFEYASQVNLRLYDNDVPVVYPNKHPSTLCDEYMGMTQYSLNQAVVCDLDVPTSDFPDPFWKSLFIEQPGDSQGDILVLVQLIKTNGRNLPDKIPNPIPRELSIIPDSREAFVEMIILGCRNLAPFNFRAMTAPFLEMTLDSLGTSYESKTQVSKVPNPDNPNFLERIVLPVRLPEKSIYASPLSIKVRDSRLGGYLKPVVGVGAIQLASKIPWCPDTYVKPASDLFVTQSSTAPALKSTAGEGAGEDHDEEHARYNAELAMLEAEHAEHEEAERSATEAAEDEDDFAYLSDETEKDNADDNAESGLLDRSSMGASKTMFDEDVSRTRVSTAGIRAGGLSSTKELEEETAGLRRHHRTKVPIRDIESGEDTSRASQIKIAKKKKDAVAQKIEEVRNQRKIDLIHDDYIVNPEPPSVEQYIQRRTADEDNGAGVFGGLKHIKVTGGNGGDAKLDNVFSDPDWSQDDGDLPPDWAIGREKLESELESDFATTPFETYDFVRGKAGKSGKFLSGKSFKIVGKLKGLIRVMESEDDEPMFPEEILNMLLKPKPYKIRLYMLRATNLTGMDLDMFGNIAKSDPYIKVTLGKFKFNDREHAVDDVTDVDLYQMIELNTELPGTSQLIIDVMDKDTIGSDDLIGRTTIDLEDRWFDTRWQELGEDQMVLPGNDPNDDTRIRWKTKPIERRSIHVASSTSGQGVVECWLDIMSPEEAQSFPPDEVALPPTQDFEVRLVVWKARDVPPMDAMEGMSDLFVKAWPEGCAPQETDTHWRAKKGKASWNYRLLFDVELGHNTRAMKFPYLYVQLWDRDILKWNDCAGEVVYNLGKFYRKAFKRNMAIKLFESKAGMQATRERKEARVKKAKVDDIGDLDMVVEEEGDEVPLLSSHNDGEEGGVELTTSAATTVDKQAAVNEKATKEANAKKKGEKKGSWFFGGGDDCTDSDSDYDSEDDTASLLDRAESAGKTKAQMEEEEDEAEEMKETVDTFKNMTGIWDIDPPDSDWIHLQKKDHNTDKVTPMGSVAISLQIWPKEKSLAMPSGAARNEPNANPFLPPPVGRIKWSWNPFVLGAELCGPKLCGYFTCCLLCTLFITIMIFFQPFLNIIINLVFIVF